MVGQPKAKHWNISLFSGSGVDRCGVVWDRQVLIFDMAFLYLHAVNQEIQSRLGEGGGIHSHYTKNNKLANSPLHVSYPAVQHHIKPLHLFIIDALLHCGTWRGGYNTSHCLVKTWGGCTRCVWSGTLHGLTPEVCVCVCGGGQCTDWTLYWMRKWEM